MITVNTYINYLLKYKGKKKGKVIPVTGRGDPKGFETSRFPHFLDNRLTGGGEVVSHTRRPAALYLQSHSAVRMITSIEKMQ
jgi:hypothetical protein